MCLYDDTIATMNYHKLSHDDVRWVGSADGQYAVSFDRFRELAEGLEYDDGFGSAEIATDLVIVGNTWWLERGEYDGSEWWTYKTMPRRTGIKDFTRLTYDGWMYEGLHGIQQQIKDGE